MKKSGLLILLFLMLFFVPKSWAYTWSYTTSFDFSLSGFSDTSSPPSPVNGPLVLTISNISGLTLPNPPSGTYIWNLNVSDYYINFGGGIVVTPTILGLPGPITLGEWDAPLASHGSYPIGNVYIPAYTLTYEQLSYSGGNYTVQNAVFSWELWNSNNYANPDDPIDKIVLTLTADNLKDTINKDLTGLDNYAGGANGLIDGSGSASFKVSAVPEPATIMLLGAGLLLVVAGRKGLFHFFG